MKMNFDLYKNLCRGALSAGATAGLLLLSSASAHAQAPQDPTAVPWWDCVMSGAREGLAYLSFTTQPDSSGLQFTFNGYEVMVPKNKASDPTEVAVGRNTGGDATRNGFETEPPPLDATQIFGSQSVEGPWNFDTQGRVVGYFYETSALICSTNVITLGSPEFIPSSTPETVTNAPDSNQVFCVLFPLFDGTNAFTGTNQAICFSNSISCSALTNSISFVGKVVEGKRLTLTATTPFGKVTYRGVPAKDLSDISGSWAGTKKQSQVVYNEFFDLTRSVLFSDIPNMYSVNGGGPAYSYMGLAILSSQKKIAFSLALNVTNGVPTPADFPIRAVTGSFNSKKPSFKTHGWEQPGGSLNDPIKFDGTRLSGF